MKPHLLARSTALALVALLAIVVSAGAQGVTTAGLSGSVTDQEARPLAGAQVTVTDTRTGGTASGVSNEAGRYVVPHLQPGGPYTVEVELIGHRPEARTGVRLALGQTELLDFAMQETAVELEALEVVAQVNPVLNRSRTGTSTTISAEEIANFPTLNRSFTDFASLSPQVSLTEGAPSVGGQNNRFNNIQIDGAANNDVFGLADSGLPGGQANAKAISLEAIEEFQVLTAPFDVRHAGFTGGLINAVTKSGTNEWQGSAYGFRTDDSFVSELEGVETGEFNDTQFGWTLGGPIQRDKIHFFTAGEFEIRDDPNPGPGFDPGGSASQAGAIEAGIDPADAQRFIDIMQSTYSLDAGTSAAISNDNPRTNLFGRLDWRINDRHRLVLRHNYSRARRDLSAFRTSFTFAMTSNLAPFTSITNSSVVQLFSRLGDRWNNEALLNVEFIRDERDPLVTFAQVEVDVDSALGSSTLVAGAERFSHANSLDQDIIQFTDNLTGSFGNHLVTIGTHNELFKFNNLFAEGSLGVYEFDDLDDLAANTPAEYFINVPFPGVDDPAAKFTALSLGFYAQDEWTVNDHLNLTFGLRVDVPLMLDDPLANPDFQDAFGLSTSDIPSGNPLWQPRFGFNWASNAERQTQVRGGAGLFAGRPPFVWMSNAYTNTGRSLIRLTCDDDNVPGFSADAHPTSCTDGTTATAGGTQRVDFFADDFRFPLDFKANLAVDHELPNGFTVTVEGLYTKSVEQFFFEEFNLVGQQGSGDASIGGRPVFGTPSDDDGGFDPVRKDDRFQQVIRGSNRSDNEAFLLTLEVQRQFADWLRLRTSYTYSDIKDLQSLFSSQATSNFGRTPVPGDPNNPPLVTSPFERQHRIVFSATGRWELGSGFGLEVTPQYFGQSGNPYAYGVRADINGDGYRGQGINRDNDLLYVPTNVSEITFRDAADAALFEDLINAEECVSSQRGQIMERSGCRNPWRNLFNLRLAVDIPGGPGNFQVVADFINLFESELQRTSNIDRIVEVLRARGRVGDDPAGEIQFDYTGPTRDANGDLNPFTTFSPASNRQVQLGLRYTF
jgi:outer membrane receptor for ferrienterochelin and colicin